MDSTFHFVSFPTLQTERLDLRRLEASDDKEIFRLRSDDRVHQFINISRARTIADATHFIEIVNKGMEEDKAVMWAITRRTDKQLMGTICIWNIEWDKNRAEIGYMLHPDFQGSGYMKEAISVVMEYSWTRLKLNEVIGNVHRLNAASIALLEKSGFAYSANENDELIYTNKRFNDRS